MENAYLTALHGMERALDDMEELLAEFHKKTYAAAFDSYCEKSFQTYQAVEAGYQNAMDADGKEQFLHNMAEAVSGKASEKLGSVKKTKKSGMEMNLNLFMVVYVFPSLHKYGGEISEPLTQQLLKSWKEHFPESNISAATQEDIQAGFKHKWCYITTAVCETFGKPDDCYELTLLRDYRDTYLMSQEDGEALIHEYYDVAPTIVKRINTSGHRTEIYERIWKDYLDPCIHMIESDQILECRDLYIRMVHELEEEYLYTN